MLIPDAYPLTPQARLDLMYGALPVADDAALERALDQQLQARRAFRLREIWTVEDLRAAAHVASADELADWVRVSLPRLDELTGQQNDPLYMAIILRKLLLRAAVSMDDVLAYLAEHQLVPCASEGVVIAVAPAMFGDLYEDPSPVRKAVGAYDIDEYQAVGCPVFRPTSELVRRIRNLSAHAILPGNSGARNAEVTLMSMAWLVVQLDALGPGTFYFAACSKLLSTKAYCALATFFASDRNTAEFLLLWAQHGFPRVEVSHKLAAALALTDAPDDVRAPWPAFNIALPDGLFPPMARVSVMSTDAAPMAVRGVLYADGTGPEELSQIPEHQRELLLNFARSLCLALADTPTQVGHYAAKPSAPGRKRAAGNPIRGARFVAGKPVTIDLREALAEAWSGKRRRGGAPSVQFLVRGHWRNQVCGVGRRERKRIWIEPFWKGPEEARVLLRTHRPEGG